MGYRVIGGRVYPVGNIPSYDLSSTQGTAIKDNGNRTSFEEVLTKQLKKKDGFTISNHAAERLRDISLNTADMQRINDGINRALEKGSKNCLILYKDVALVTSIENRTVITAVQGERMKENIFTNIDSVVMI